MSTALPNPPPREPQVIWAGDYVQWTRGSEKFPATSWTLEYTLRGPEVYNFTATTNGQDFLVSLDQTTTAAWKPGFYTVMAFVSDTEGQRFPFAPRFSIMEIRANPQSNPQGDPNARGWLYTLREALREAITKLGSRQVANASVNGQSYSLQDISKLWTQLNWVEEQIRYQEQSERLSAGLGANKNILVRFRKPWPIAGPFPWGAGPWPP